MSTVAVSYDPRVDMAMRSPFAWSGYPEAGEMMGSQEMGQMGPGSDASGTPPIGNRSLTASPPKGLTRQDERDFKRHFAMARRDSKTSIRARRTMSSYSASSQSPPLPVHEFSASPSMSAYSAAPSQPHGMPSLLSNEPVSSVASQSYVPAYAPEHGQASMFPGPYDYINMGYPSPSFPPTPPASSLSSQYPRTPSLPEQQPMMYGMPPVLPSGNSSAQEPVRVLQTRPKPQCWEHGCNGRQFSTFSNLLRHQREKSGQAAKATCPNCGAEFTRTTARNGHLAHDKCKSRRNSSGQES